MFLTKIFMLGLGLVIGATHTSSLYSDCSVEICDSIKVEMDSTGRFWPRYCYKCPEGEDEVIFMREYFGKGWKYTVRKHDEFQGRLILDVLPCGETEIDSMGNVWTKWCYGDNKVNFEKIGGRIWVYKQDYAGGYPRLQFRRIIVDNVFAEISQQENNDFLQEKIQSSEETQAETKQAIENFGGINQENLVEEIQEEIDNEVREDLNSGKENYGSEVLDCEKKDEEISEGMFGLNDTVEEGNFGSITETFEVKFDLRSESSANSSQVTDTMWNTDSNRIVKASLEVSGTQNQNSNQSLAGIINDLQDLASYAPQPIENISNLEEDSEEVVIEGQTHENLDSIGFESDEFEESVGNEEKNSEEIEEYEEGSTESADEYEENSEEIDINNEINAEESNAEVISQEIDEQDLSYELESNDSEATSVVDSQIIEENLANSTESSEMIHPEKLAKISEVSCPLAPPPLEVLQPITNCRKLEGEKSGKYYFVDYYSDGSPVQYDLDENGNFVYDPKSHSRINSNFLALPISETLENNPCKIYNSQGIALQFESDLYLQNVFWEIVFDNGQQVQFIPACKSQDKLNGMYLIDPDTGYRFRSFFN